MLDTMILIDLETQSFEVESGIFEVACLVIEKGEKVDELYLAKEIPGYVGERTYGFGFYDISRSFEQIQRFQEFLRRYPYPLVAHNCPFDRKFLNYYGWVGPGQVFYCSLRAIRAEVKGLESYSIGSLVRHYGIASDSRHEAMWDIQHLYLLLQRIQPQSWFPLEKNPSVSWSKTKPRPLDAIDLPIPTTTALRGETLCFTGGGSYPRHILQEIALKNGAALSNGVTRKTTLLVVGNQPGSKLEKAREKNVETTSVEEFLEKLGLKEALV